MIQLLLISLIAVFGQETEELSCEEGTVLIDGECIVSNLKICDPDDAYAYDCGVADLNTDMTGGAETVLTILIFAIPVSVIAISYTILIKKKQ